MTHNDDSKTPVSVLGLGHMGTALARAFLTAGYPTTVWNRSPEKGGPLAEVGAELASTPADAIAVSAVVVTCVNHYGAVRDVLAPASEDGFGDRILVNLTSGTPSQARELAAWSGERAIEYVDGAILAVPPAIGSPDALFLYSGSRSAYEAAGATLAALGGEHAYVGGDPGMASVYDLALLAMLWTATLGYLHALALVGSADVSPHEFLPFATAWHENLLLPDLALTADEVAAGSYETDVSSIAVNKAAIDHLVEASEEAGLRTDVIAPIQALLNRRLSEGAGPLSLASLIEALRQPLRAD
jgi:3-hydroxyisobutyrate dehydrogenase-like beta-hydroxyacid dehydrogenase